MTLNRLPRWVQSADVSIGIVNNSHILLFEDSKSESDRYRYCGNSGSDVQFFCGLPSAKPTGACIDIARIADGKKDCVFVVMVGEKQDTILVLQSQVAFTNAGYTPYHLPLGLMSIVFRLMVNDWTIATRFIPFAILVNDQDIHDVERFIRPSIPHIIGALEKAEKSAWGDYYEGASRYSEVLEVTKEKSVIVLGRHGMSPDDMVRVRDRLRGLGYDANRLMDLREIPQMSAEEKCKLWGLASRFCVIIDKEPSGHIAEHEWLKSQRTVTAVIRPRGKGSTYMIGDESAVDFNFIKTFEFDRDPSEIIEDVVQWAEILVQRRISEYGKLYPWRQER